MKRKKVYNDFLPSMKVEGTFDHPDYDILLRTPVCMHPRVCSDNQEEYDCLLDPFSSLLAIFKIVSDIFDNTMPAE